MRERQNQNVKKGYFEEVELPFHMSFLKLKNKTNQTKPNLCFEREKERKIEIEIGDRDKVRVNCNAKSKT